MKIGLFNLEPKIENTAMMQVSQFHKEHKVWKNQAERIEARATVHPKYKHLKFVDVICDCHSAKCKSWSAERDLRIQELVSGFGRIFHGKIKIHKGFLIGKVYDIELSDKRLPRKSKK